MAFPQLGLDIANLVTQSRLQLLACDHALSQAYDAEYTSRKARRETIRALHQRRQTALHEYEVQRHNLSQAIDHSSNLPHPSTNAEPQDPSRDSNVKDSLRAINSMIHSLNQWIAHACSSLAEYGRPDNEEEAGLQEQLRACIGNAQEDLVRWREEGGRLLGRG
jgi:hypothetical protein